MERLEEIAALDLPWNKVGIAHPNCGLIFREGDINKVFRLIDEKRYRSVMRSFAAKGAGIELNTGCFGKEYIGHEEDQLRLFRMAKEEGCKFYLASDAHHPTELDLVPLRAPDIIERLELTETDQYHIPA